MDASITPSHERVLVEIIRTLPPDRAEQLMDFARFLEGQMLSEELLQDDEAEKIEEDNAQWDALVGTDAGQVMLEKLAQEALAEHRAGRSRPMNIDEKGRIAPE